MADRESTAVGYRLRIQPPGGLSTYPDAVKLMWYQWVVELGLKRKDRELAQGKDKDGVVGVLAPATIKHRKSEVGPTTPAAPFLTPSYARSRVRSLLTGRAHTGSAEFWWAFDAVSGRSFATILHYQAEAGHDVFGLSPLGIAWVTREATKRWAAWLAEGHHGRPAVSPVGEPIRKVAVLKPVRKVPIGRTDLENMTAGAGARDSETLAAIAAGQHTGFRRLNLAGEKWKPFTPVRVRAVTAKPKLPLPPEPVTPASVKMTPAERLAELSAYTATLGVESHVISTEEFTARFAGAAIDKAMAAYDPKTRAIWWNTNAPAWANVAKHLETQRKEKFLVDPRPIGVAHHEVGHARLHAELVRQFGLEEGTRRYRALSRDEFKGEMLLRALIKKKASRLAAIDKNEFVAEIYSGLVIGRTYPADVMALYDSLGGVRP